MPAGTTHPKLVELIRTKQNMYGTWCKNSIYSREVVLEQSLTLRLGGSGLASKFALCRYPAHSILLYPYVHVTPQVSEK